MRTTQRTTTTGPRGSAGQSCAARRCARDRRTSLSSHRKAAPRANWRAAQRSTTGWRGDPAPSHRRSRPRGGTPRLARESTTGWRRAGP
eukprot:2759471-Pleurochrysis_carterae.AAC.1